MSITSLTRLRERGVVGALRVEGCRGRSVIPTTAMAAKSSPDNFIILLPTLRELLPRDLKFMKRKGKENEDKLIKVLNHFF